MLLDFEFLFVYVCIYTVSAKNIRTKKIFFKNTLFLKSIYYPARNELSNRCQININTMISTSI